MPTVFRRSYREGSENLRHCATCLELCLPFPHKDSLDCSWCWFLKYQLFRTFIAATK